MKKEAFYNIINEMAPLSYAMPGDNSGIQIETERSEIKKILVSLDVTPDTVQEAAANKCDIILTHHPLFFKKLGSILSDSTARIIRDLIRNDIGLVSFHTNFDVAADTWKNFFNLSDEQVIEPVLENRGIGLLGTLPHPETVASIAQRIKNFTKTQYLQYVGRDIERRVERIAFCSGSGMSLLQRVQTAGAELFITGDVKYHDALYAYLNRLDILDAGHFGTEIVYKNEMKEKLSNYVEVIVSEKDINPFGVIL